ncbi:unnamed protein product [Effrenium voratum]|nr:unnamed protein product [Effrenium voratum]
MLCCANVHDASRAFALTWAGTEERGGVFVYEELKGGGAAVGWFTRLQAVDSGKWDTTKLALLVGSPKAGASMMGASQTFNMNLAWNSGVADAARAAVEALWMGWIKSPGHRKNLLGAFDLCGLGQVSPKRALASFSSPSSSREARVAHCAEPATPEEQARRSAAILYREHRPSACQWKGFLIPDWGEVMSRLEKDGKLKLEDSMAFDNKGWMQRSPQLENRRLAAEIPNRCKLYTVRKPGSVLGKGFGSSGGYAAIACAEKPLGPCANHMATGSFSLLAVLGSGSSRLSCHHRSPLAAYQAGSILALWDYTRVGEESRKFILLCDARHLLGFWRSSNGQPMLTLWTKEGSRPWLSFGKSMAINVDFHRETQHLVLVHGSSVRSLAVLSASVTLWDSEMGGRPRKGVVPLSFESGQCLRPLARGPLGAGELLALRLVADGRHFASAEARV